MVVFGFRRNDGTNYEKMVSFLTGEYVHVDIIVDEYAYTAYIEETFSKALADFANPLYTYMRLDLPAEEEQKVKEWLEAHVDKKTPYNYNDLRYCVLPSIFRKIKDTEETAVETLFCSQACVLALRSAVEANSDVKQAVCTVNSRVCTPNAFYRLISPFCVPI